MRSFHHTLKPALRSPVHLAAAFTLLHGLFNAISVRLLGVLSLLSVVFHVVGTLVIVIGLPIIAVTHQKASWVFGHFQVSGGKAAMHCVVLQVVGLLLRILLALQRCPRRCSHPWAAALGCPFMDFPSPSLLPHSQNYGNDPEFMGEDTTGITNSFYSFLLGLLLSQWAMVRGAGVGWGV